MEVIRYFGADVVIYAVLGILLVRAIWNFTSRRLYRWLAVTVVVLLPTWDAVLSPIIFYSACPFVPESAIYQTAETEGVYYERKNLDTVMTVTDWKGRRSIISIGASDLDFKNGYQYVEVLVTAVVESGIEGETPLARPVIYRCTLLPIYPERPNDYPFSCSPVEYIQSEYTVKLDVIKVALVSFNYLKIFNRSTGALMAEYRDLFMEPYRGWTWAPVPFFNWLGWGEAIYGGAACPEKLRYEYFQYEVLKGKTRP